VGRSRAFTLVELLIAVAIIVLLVAIALPAFQNISHRIKILACGNNLRAAHQVLITYAELSHGEFPLFHSYYGGSIFHPARSYEPLNVTMGDAFLLRQVGAVPEMWFCPLDPYYGRDSWYWETWTNPQHTLSLGYTVFMNRRRDTAEGPVAARFSDGRPSPSNMNCDYDTPLVADVLRIRDGGRPYGWHHGGGARFGSTDGLMNSSCHTLFRGGYVVLKEWGDLDKQGAGLDMGTASGDLWWFWLGSEPVD